MKQQRRSVEHVKKLVRVKNAGGLYKHPVVAAHTHGDQLDLKSPAMAVVIATPATISKLQLGTSKELSSIMSTLTAP